MISPTFLTRFNRAAECARDGRHEDALHGYERVFDPFTHAGEPRVATDQFLAQVEMRKGYCLMDLGRYESARAVFEGRTLRSVVGNLELSELCDYFYSYGNTLGHLGLTAEMDEAMTRALQLAAGELGDLGLCEQIWFSLLTWGRRHQAWEYLEEQCVYAAAFAANTGSEPVQTWADEFACHALRGQHRYQEAREGAGLILRKLRHEGAPSGVLAEWEGFLQAVSAS